MVSHLFLLQTHYNLSKKGALLLYKMWIRQIHGLVWNLD